MTMGIDTSDWPSLERVILPSRAFMLSWQDQTLPARRAALDDAVAYAQSLVAGPPTVDRDMSVLAVIHDAMQPLEDFAYLATAWGEPFQDLANYVRATVYSDRTPTNFWQGAHKRDDTYLDMLAGFAGRDLSQGGVLQRLGADTQLTAEALAALDEARLATRRKLRMLLPILAGAWKTFSDYFYAYKHGGLIVDRPDVQWHDADDEVGAGEHTRREEPNLAVWLRGGKALEGRGEFGLPAGQIIREAAGPGRIALQLVEAFIRSRVAVFDAIDVADDGQIVGLKPMLVPWTAWLAEAELSPRTWALIGAGPRLTWIAGEPPASI